MARILIIDDDQDLVEMLTLMLETKGYQVITANNGEAGLLVASQQNPDLILLDVMMPHLDGFETCRRFKMVANTPIIMLTARADEISMIQGLNTGADDYITKPYENKILLAKIKALLRRSHTVRPIKATYTDNYLTIALTEGKILVDNQNIKLTATEFRLLAYLFRNADRVVPHDELIREVWGEYSETDKRSLKLYILYLRRKIEKNPNKPHYLQTAWGIGYRFYISAQAQQSAIMASS